MIRVFLAAFLSLFIAYSFGGQAKAEEVKAEEAFATCEEAKAMAIKAAEYLKAHGPKKSFAAFNDPNGDFRDRDLYIFVFNEQGNYEVHAVKQHMKDRSVLPLKDVMGSPFGKDIMAVKDTGWVHYKYPDPINMDIIKDKKSYILKVGRYTLGSGCYMN